MKIRVGLTILFGFFVFAKVMADEMTVSGQYMEVLNSASRGSPVAFLMERGEKFSLLKQKTDWIKVETTNGQSGWINRSEFLEQTSQTSVSNKRLNNISWGLGVSSGYFGDDRHHSLTFLYLPFKVLSIEAAYSKISGEYSNSRFLTGDLLLHFFYEHRVRPFLSVNYGLFENQPRKSLIKGDRTQETISGFSAGLNINAYKRFIFRFSIGDYQLSQSGKNYLDWRVGVFAQID